MRYFDVTLNNALYSIALHDISEDFDGTIRWEDYVRNCGYKPQELDLVFHATHSQNLESIMKFGLDPKNSVHADDEELNDAEDLGPPYHFVYLSHSQPTSLAFGPGGEYSAGQINDCVLLGIRLPQQLKEQLILDRGEFIRAPFIIPPEYIEVIGP